MRSFASRPDTAVIDEPLYGYYLARTKLDHPGRDEVIASMPTSWRAVIRGLTADPLPPGKTVFYQKHMTHHLLREVDRGSLASLRHAYLIRSPRQLLASYARVREPLTLADLGLEQQAKIYRQFGGPVVDAADLAASPQEVLQRLCAALGLDFDPAMLSWEAGPQPFDGVWGKYWYASVWQTTGFSAAAPAEAAPAEPAPAEPAPAEPAAAEAAPAAPDSAAPLPPHLDRLASRCQPFYEELAEHRLHG